MAKDLAKPKTWAEKMRDREPPRVALDWTPENTLKLQISGDWARILKASGNVTVSDGLIGQAVNERLKLALTQFWCSFGCLPFRALQRAEL